LLREVEMKKIPIDKLIPIYQRAIEVQKSLNDFLSELDLDDSEASREFFVASVESDLGRFFAAVENYNKKQEDKNAD
jgi:hypothetical protein